MSTYQPCPVCGVMPSEHAGIAPERRDSTGKVTHPERPYVRVAIVHDIDYHGGNDRPVTRHLHTQRSPNFGERNG